MTTKPAPFKPDEVVVAICAFGHVRGDVAAGTRLRGDDPVVVRYPSMFVADGADADVGAAIRERSIELWPMSPPPAPPSPRVQAPPPVADADAVIAIRDTWHDGGVVAVGSMLDKRHKLVKAHPDSFVPMACGIPRDRARVATQAIKEFGASGEDGQAQLQRHVHRGQWVDADTELIAVYPMHFIGVEEG